MSDMADEFALRAFRDALVPGDPSAVVQLLELEIQNTWRSSQGHLAKSKIS